MVYNIIRALKICYFLGGSDIDFTEKTTEMIYLNGSKTEGPIELPEPRYGHCMVKYGDIIILMGGEYATHIGQFWLNS